MPYGFEIPGNTPAAGAASVSPNQQTEQTFGQLFPPPPMNAQPSAVPFPASAPTPSMPDRSTMPVPQGSPYANPFFSDAEARREALEQQALIAEREERLSAAEKNAALKVNNDADLDNIFNQLQTIWSGGGEEPTDFKGEETLRDKNDRMAKMGLGDYMKTEVKKAIGQLGAGLSDSPEEKVARFSKAWEDPETGAKVAYKNGKMYVQYPNSKGYIPVRGSEAITNFILNNAKDVLDLAGNVATDVAGAPLAVGLGPIAGPIVGGTVAAAGGLVGKMAVGGARKAYDFATGYEASPEEEKQLMNDALLSAGLNAGGMAAFSAGSKLLKSGYQYTKEIMKEGAPLQRIYRVADIRNRFANFLDDYSGGAYGIKRGEEKAARVANDAVSGAVEDMARTIESVESRAKMIAGDRKFPLTNTRKMLREVLEDHGAIIDEKTGKVSLPDDAALSSVREFEEQAKGLRKQAAKSADPIDADTLSLEASELESAAMEARAEAAPAVARMNTALGSFKGRAELENMAQMYENFTMAESVGGVDVKTALADIKAFRERARLGGQLEANTDIEAVFNQLQNAAAQDRQEIVGSILRGSGLPEEQLFEKAYANFHGKIDNYRELLKVFQRQKDLANFVGQVGNNPDMIRDLRKILGTNSPQWKQFRGEYVGRILKDSLDPVNGLMDGKKLVKSLVDLPDSVKTNLFSNPKKFNNLVGLGRVLETIPTSDILTGSQKSALSQLVAAVMPGANKVTIVRAMLNMTGGNERAMNYLVNDAMHQLAVTSPKLSDKKMWSQAAAYAQEVMNQMQAVDIPRKTAGGKRVPVRTLVPKVLSQAVVNEGNPGVTRSENPNVEVIPGRRQSEY